MSKVVVLGSINMDVVAHTGRHPVVGETVVGTALAFVPGGKGANQAVAASRLAAPTELVGRVGSDVFATMVLDFLATERISGHGVRRLPNVATGTALVVVDDAGDNTIVVVPGANHALTVADAYDLPIERNDIVVLQFELPLEVVHAALARARAIGARSVLNPAPAQASPPELLALADFLVVNQSELAFFAGARASESGVGNGGRRRRRGLGRRPPAPPGRGAGPGPAGRAERAEWRAAAGESGGARRQQPASPAEWRQRPRSGRRVTAEWPEQPVRVTPPEARTPPQRGPAAGADPTWGGGRFARGHGCGRVRRAGSSRGPPATRRQPTATDRTALWPRARWPTRLHRLRRRPDQVVIATLGAGGVVALIGSEVISIPGRVVPVVDTTGAGDCFVGALAAALCSWSEVVEAIHFANLAASLAVQRPGAGPGMPYLADIEALA